LPPTKVILAQFYCRVISRLMPDEPVNKAENSA